MRVFKLTLLSSSGEELAELLWQRQVRMVLTVRMLRDAGTAPGRWGAVLAAE